MRNLLKWGGIALAALLLIGIGASLGGNDDTKSSDAARTSDNTRGKEAAANATKDDDGDGVLNPYDPEPDNPDVSNYAEEEETPQPVREAANPDGRYELNCDYTLPDDIDSEDYRFIAGGTLENTGNVGIVVQITYKWDLLGQAPFKEQKTYRVKRGREKDVNVSFPVTSDMIDAHQSADGDCKTTVRIVDSFGTPPFE